MIERFCIYRADGRAVWLYTVTHGFCSPPATFIMTCRCHHACDSQLDALPTAIERLLPPLDRTTCWSPGSPSPCLYLRCRLMGSLVAALLQRAAAELHSRPYSPADDAIVHEELPEPMLEVPSPTPYMSP